MKAALLKGVKDLKVTQVPTPQCKEGELLIKVEACGICRTDMKAFYYGQRDLHLPRILGHEIVGTIVEIGVGVNKFLIGDRVQVAPGLPCGKCHFCHQGQDHLCESVQVMGFHYDGGFAEYVLIPANGVRYGVINNIPNHLSFCETVLTEPLACSINMQDAVNVWDGDTVVIYGAGPLGRLNARLSRMRGAKMIILIEIDENRLSSVSPVDFDYCINPRITDPIGKILDITDGKGADVVIPCCPSPEVLNTGFKVLAKKGRFGFFSGLIMDSQLSNIDINLIHYKELMVYGAYGCSTLHNHTALKLLGNGEIQVKDMITRILALDEVLAGIEMVAGRKEIKIVINY